MATEHNGNSRSVPPAQNGTLGIGDRTDNSEHTGTMDSDSPDIIAVKVTWKSLYFIQPTGRSLL